MDTNHILRTVNSSHIEHKILDLAKEDILAYPIHVSLGFVPVPIYDTIPLKVRGSFENREIVGVADDLCVIIY